MMSHRTYVWSALALAAILFCGVNVFANNVFTDTRLDLTHAGTYTLSDGTRAIIAKLPEPVTLRLYFSKKNSANYPVTAAYAKRVRDLLWIPTLVHTGDAFKGTELGEVLVPALFPLSSRHPDDAVKLGRLTVWAEEEGEPVPYGQKTMLVDGEEMPILELRKLEITQPEPAPESHAAAE